MNNILKTRIKKCIKFFLKIILTLHLIIIFIVLIISFYLRDHNPESTSLMLYRKRHDNYKIKKVLFIPLAEIKNNVRKMFIKTEDPSFPTHHGIHIGAIINAYRLNKKLGYIKWGGSTITQQLARSLILIPAKTYSRKYIEIITALTMELVLSKDRILELYINYIEFGEGVFGIGQGARFYYKRSYNRLNTDEIIKLVTILPNPLKYNPENFMSNRHLKRRYYNLVKNFNQE